MAAGLAQLKELERRDGWNELEKLGALFEAGVREVLGKGTSPFTFNRIGSMFCLFFAEGEVFDLNSAQKSDRNAFASYFHYCLDHGIYFAPSQFETGFISLAHTAADIARTSEVAAEALQVAKIK